MVTCILTMPGLVVLKPNGIIILLVDVDLHDLNKDVEGSVIKLIRVCKAL